jgi:hypothetical protein
MRDTDGAGLIEYFDVQLVSGEKLQVQTKMEQRQFNNSKAKYKHETKFTEATDLQDLDRLLVAELMLFRWHQHLTAGFDYERNPVDDERLRRNIKDQSETINRLKMSMGLNKAARNALLDQGNFADLWEDLRKKAKAFGIHRENQLRKALVLMNQLSANVGSFDRADAHERKKLGFETEADIVAWIRDTMLPEYRQVDEHFRANEQKMWRRDNL